MRNLILTILILTGQFCFGQKREFSFQVNSGLFSFGGELASSTSFMNISDVRNISDYTNNPYGSNSSFSYGVGVQFQQLTSNNFIYGLQLSYESLSSKLTIDNAYGEITWSVKDGKTILTNNFINLFPSIGQRFKILNGLESDLLFGFDFGIGLSSIEKYSLTSNQGHGISGTNEREIPNIDFRPRIEFINYYKNFGLSIGYSYGLTNYQSGLDGGDKEAKARYPRFGLNYRLR
ncbi:MAG: hypothetical protein RIE59_09900 [Imperialibacter sp.]